MATGDGLMETTGVQRVALETSIPQSHLYHLVVPNNRVLYHHRQAEANARRYIRRDNLIWKNRWESSWLEWTVCLCHCFDKAKCPVGE